MSKLILPNRVRAARGMPLIEPIVEPVEIKAAPPPKKVVPSKKKLSPKKLERLQLFKAHVAAVKVGIADRVAGMTVDETKLRLAELKIELVNIKRDLLAFERGETQITKLIESGLAPKVWRSRAQLARRYMVFEKRLLLKKTFTVEIQKCLT